MFHKTGQVLAVEYHILESFVVRYTIWYILSNFKKLEKHPWKSVTFSKVVGFSL